MFLKRLKSGAITLISILGVIVVTPEFSTVVGDLKQYLLDNGFTTSVVALIVVIVSEIWKHILNKIQISKATTAGYTSGSNGLDLY